jgi:hypothetical protein
VRADLGGVSVRWGGGRRACSGVRVVARVAEGDSRHEEVDSTCRDREEGRRMEGGRRGSLEKDSRRSEEADSSRGGLGELDRAKGIL